MLAEQVDLYTANLGSVSAFIDAGKVRPIAVTADKRWPDLPDIATMEEVDDKDAVSDTFQGIYVRAGTPQSIVDRLAQEISAILARPDVNEKFARSGLPVLAEGPTAFRARVQREVPMYKEIIDKAGLRIP